MIKQSRRQFLLTTAAAAAAVSAGSLPSWAQSRSMKIGIIGSGKQGGALGILFAKAGHQVFFSSRHPEELKDVVAKAGNGAKAGLPQDAATFGDVVMMSPNTTWVMACSGRRASVAM